MGRVAVVVNDDLTMAAAVKVMLERLGWEVRVRADGTEARELIDQMDEAPSVVVTDNHMILMHGDELIGKLRHREPHLPIVMMTGDPVLPGVPWDVPVLRKPFRRDDLLDAITLARFRPGPD